MLMGAELENSHTMKWLGLLLFLSAVVFSLARCSCFRVCEVVVLAAEYEMILCGPNGFLNISKSRSLYFTDTVIVDGKQTLT